jgi:hypothetical protein
MTSVRLFAFLLVASLACISADARASVARPATLQDLVRDSSAAVVYIARTQTSAWEDGRIVTTTRGTVDQSVAGALAEGDEVEIRTLGGSVGDVGQIVEGEPIFAIGRRDLVFLRATGERRYVVTGRAQGQYAVATGEILSRGAPIGGLRVRGAPTCIQAPLEGRPLREAALAIAGAWSRGHAR